MVMTAPATGIDSKELDRVQDDISSLDFQFSGWQQRFLQWMAYAFPGNPIGAVMSHLGSIYDAGGVKRVEDSRSRYVSSWISTRVNASLNRRTASKTNILPIVYGDDDADEKMVERRQKLVQFGDGLFTALDWQKARGAGGFSWDYQMKQLGTYCGKVAFHTRVYPDGKDRLCVQAPFLDPLNLTHDIDVEENQVLRIVHKMTMRWSDIPTFVEGYTAGRADALPTPDMPLGMKPAEKAIIQSYWRRDPDGSIHRALLINAGKEGKTPMPIRQGVTWTDHGYDRLPITVLSRPEATHNFQLTIAEMTLNSQTYYHAVPFYAAAIPELRFLEGLESLAADGAALAALPIFLHKKEGGRDGVNKRDIKPFAFLELATNEQLQVLQNITQGSVTVDSAIQRIKQNLNDVWPDFLVGQAFQDSGSSGFKFNSQIGQAKMYMVPWTRIDETAKRELVANVVSQHQNVYPGKFFYLTGVVETTRYAIKFGVKDYPEGDFDIDFEEPAEIPGEELQNLQAAIQATQAHLVSLRTARITKLGISDPDAEQKLVDDDEFHMSPEAAGIRKLEKLQAKVQDLEAEAQDTTDGSKKQVQAQIALVAAKQELKAVRQSFLGAPNSGYQMNQDPNNPAPAQLPPQAGVENPDILAAAQGQTRAGTQGRPRPKGKK